MTMRTIIAFASGDLGFPDLYRTLGDGTKVFVPKGGSQWGGLLSDSGQWSSSQAGGCYNPSYFAPGHYRAFRDFVASHWKPSYDAYLPPHLDGSPSTVAELRESFDGAVIGGYNLLERSSCASGVVANWVGSAAPCPNDDLNCAGVPWAHTPYVGASGTCSASGTVWGGWGADASRTPWRIAMDYILYPTEMVKIYDNSGLRGASSNAAQAYLNRIARQYKEHSQCDGGNGGCADAGKGGIKTYQIQPAFGSDFVTCDNVPNTGDGWWSAFMSYPTFTAFVAPYSGLSEAESRGWLETFSSLCSFSGGTPSGDICSTSYFEAGQEVISTMVMSGVVASLGPAPPPAPTPPSPVPTPRPTPRPSPVPTPPAPTPSGCPGGSLSNCIALCPAGAAYQPCVQACLARCSQVLL